MDDLFSVTVDTQLSVGAVGVLANDTDADGDALTVQLVEGPTNGTLVLLEDGSFTYDPDSGFLGLDVFTYVVSDGTLTSEPTSVALEVGVGGAQVAVTLVTTDLAGNTITSITAGDRFQLQVFFEDLSAEPRDGVFAAFTDIAFDPSLAVVADPIIFAPAYSNGTSGIVSTPGLIDEAGGFDGLDPLGPGALLVFTVPMQAVATGTVTFTADPAEVSPAHDILLFDEADAIPANQADYGSTTLTIGGLTEPVAVDDQFEVDAETLLEVTAANGVLANDTGVNGGNLTAVLVDDAQNGTLTLNSDGSFTYVPDNNFAGTDTFTYRAVANDGSMSDIATATITVGNISPSTISGSAYLDVNNNGIQEPIERTLGGVTITLRGTDLFGQTILETTETTRDGRFSFAGVLSGDYVLSAGQPVALVDGKDTRNGVESPTNDAFTIDLAAGTDATGFAFGERGLRPEYFGNPNFFTSVPPEGAKATIDPNGTQSWFSFKTGWDAFRSVIMNLSDDLSAVTVTAIDLNGDAFAATIPVLGNPRVKLLGNATEGFLVQLMGASSEFGLTPIAPTPAAVDAVFGA